MTKFVFLADTHVGGSRTGYFEQQNYPERLPELMRELASWIDEAGDIDFVVHGGDIVEEPTEELIASAADVFSQLPVSVYLCLGNHDMSDDKAVARWLDNASGFFPDRSFTYTLRRDDCLIHVLPTQWGVESYQGGGGVEPHLLPEQLRFLEEALELDSELPHIVVTHYPMSRIPLEQSGGVSLPPLSLASLELMKRVECGAGVAMVMAGHSHVNTCVLHHSTYSVSSSSYVETPFEFKVVEVGAEGLSMKTISLASRIGFIGEYNFDKTFVQGRHIDRTIIKE